MSTSKSSKVRINFRCPAETIGWISSLFLFSSLEVVQFLEHGLTCISENAFLLNRDGRITCSSYVSDFFLLALDFVFLELEGRHQVDPTVGMDHQGVAFLQAEDFPILSVSDHSLDHRLDFSGMILSICPSTW